MINTKNLVDIEHISMGGQSSIGFLELKIWTMLSAFYPEMGGDDVGRFSEFFGILGGSTFYRLFRQHSSKVNGIILYLCDLIMTEYLSSKVKATIKEKLYKTYDDDTINNNIRWFEMREYGKMSPCVLTVGIVVSYNMGR